MRTATPLSALGAIAIITVIPALGSALLAQDEVEEPQGEVEEPQDEVEESQDEVEEPSEEPSEQDDAEVLTQEQKEEAKHHFVAGGKRYKEGEYQAAIDHFEMAYDITHAPELLYNTGRCYEELGNKPRAISHYEMYLRLSPDVEDADQVRSRIDAMKSDDEPASKDDDEVAVESGDEDPVVQGVPPGLCLAGDVGFEAPLTGDWERKFIPLDVAMHFPLADWLYVIGGLGFGGFVGEEPRDPGYPTGLFSISVGLLGSWPMAERFSFMARIAAVPVFLFRERHETAIWLQGQAGIGLGIRIAGSWSISVRAVGGIGPVFVPKKRDVDPWDIPGLSATVGGRIGFIYVFK